MKNQEVDLGINLYDLNKELIKNEKALDPILFNKEIKNASEDMLASFKKYWMLLSNERKDYTVFVINSSKDLEKELKETILNRGEVVSFSKQEDGNFEIWIRDDNKENFVYYLFDYTFGVVEV